MNVICPICKKEIARSNEGIGSHLRRKDHNLSKLEQQRIRHELFHVEPETGSLSRDKSSRELEKSLTHYLNR